MRGGIGGKLIVGAVAVAAALLASASPAAAHSGCSFSATVDFTPPIVSESQPFSYVLDGEVAGCLPVSVIAPLDGVVTAGQPGVTIQGVTFDEPVPSGVGGCREAAASGTLWIAWADGTVTIVDYETTGLAAALLLQGDVVPARTVIGSDSLPHTITTTRDIGESATAALVSLVDDPAACEGAGIPTAQLDGLLAYL